MITVATLLWQPGRFTPVFSRMYDESWPAKVFRGFARNTTLPFHAVLYTDRVREIEWACEQRLMKNGHAPGYSDCLQPYEMNVPMILVGLDTIICGNVDHLVDYCMTADKIALPRDPYHPHQVCNGVALVPAGMAHIWNEFDGSCSDMELLRKYPHAIIDDLWPGHVVSYKGHVKQHGLGDARIVYFHGEEKPHQLADKQLIQRHWL